MSRTRRNLERAIAVEGLVSLLERIPRVVWWLGTLIPAALAFVFQNLWWVLPAALVVLGAFVLPGGLHDRYLRRAFRVALRALPPEHEANSTPPAHVIRAKVHNLGRAGRFRAQFVDTDGIRTNTTAIPLGWSNRDNEEVLIHAGDDVEQVRIGLIHQGNDEVVHFHPWGPGLEGFHNFDTVMSRPESNSLRIRLRLVNMEQGLSESANFRIHYEDGRPSFEEAESW